MKNKKTKKDKPQTKGRMIYDEEFEKIRADGLKKLMKPEMLAIFKRLAKS
ncbi:hypothetical protein [Campylobacter sp. RM15925]|nr:hypothetical protein [Campylobacter sp. RM15925]